MAHHIKYKLPRARKESDFIVYPFEASDIRMFLQSDNHCIIIDTVRNFMSVSKRFAQYPSFSACSPTAGGKIVDIPEEIQKQVDEIMKTPTGKVVDLV